MNTDDDNLLAAFDATLAEIVETSSIPPSWCDAWKCLGPESSEEDRLAVYRAVRDAGCLPAEAGMSLIAWQIGAIVNREDGGSLKDLDDRMVALDQAYPWETGDPGPDDEVPQEYEELRKQYEDAWVRIYVAKFEAFGEPEMAGQYRADPDEFLSRYNRGLRYFEEAVRYAGRVLPDELVRLTSCWDVPRADLVRMALAEEEIPAAFGNANFLGWLWHYGNAVGGVTVHVCRRNAPQARKALADAQARPMDSRPAWSCPACGTRISGQWDACWRCGRWADARRAMRPPRTRRRGRPVTPIRDLAKLSRALRRGDMPGARQFVGEVRPDAGVDLRRALCAPPRLPAVAIRALGTWRAAAAGNGRNGRTVLAQPPKNAKHRQPGDRPAGVAGRPDRGFHLPAVGLLLDAAAGNWAGETPP